MNAGARYAVTWHTYPARLGNWHLHVNAIVLGRSPTVVTTVHACALPQQGWWEVVAGELLPLRFFGPEKMLRRRMLHLALELLNGAVTAVCDELVKEP